MLPVPVCSLSFPVSGPFPWNVVIEAGVWTWPGFQKQLTPGAGRYQRLASSLSQLAKAIGLTRGWHGVWRPDTTEKEGRDYHFVLVSPGVSPGQAFHPLVLHKGSLGCTLRLAMQVHEPACRYRGEDKGSSWEGIT